LKTTNTESYHKPKQETYTEYRTGLMKCISLLIANKTLYTPEQKDKFIELLGNSKDLKLLLVENNFTDSIDEIDGPIKIALTIFAKYFEAKNS
jgi:hypothetical protein